MVKESNKRKCIRIRDRVFLHYREMAVEEFEARMAAIEDGSDLSWDMETVPYFKKIDGFLKKIRSDNDALAQVLGIIDDKLNFIIGKLVEMDGDGSEKSSTPVTVDISTEGIGFFSKNPMEVGTLLEITIGLLPEHYFFRAYGKVLRSQEQNGNWFNGVQFLWKSHEAEERLMEHIFSRQLKQLRLRRLQREQDEM